MKSESALQRWRTNVVFLEQGDIFSQLHLSPQRHPLEALISGKWQ